MLLHKAFLVFIYMLQYVHSMDDPSDLSFDWDIAACPNNQFRRVKNGVEECKRCFKPTIKGVYSSAVTDGDDRYKHGQCCTNPTHHVCRKMKAEYEDRCSCTDPANAHCFDSFNPSGVNVLHLDLSLLEGDTTFAYTEAAGANQLALLPDGYTANSKYTASVKLTGFDTVISIPIEYQMTVIDCTGALQPWCNAFIPSCTTPTVRWQDSNITITNPTNQEETDWVGKFTATWLNRAGDAGDITFTIVDYAENQAKLLEYATDIAQEDYTALDAWQLENNIKQCFTPDFSACPVESRRRLAETFAGRSRRRKLGRDQGGGS